VAEQHVVHRLRREGGALEDPADDGGRQVLGRHVAQRAAEPADGRAQRLADDRVAHEAA
jgi:hypothetical protein